MGRRFEKAKTSIMSIDSQMTRLDLLSTHHLLVGHTIGLVSLSVNWSFVHAVRCPESVVVSALGSLGGVGLALLVDINVIRHVTHSCLVVLIANWVVLLASVQYVRKLLLVNEVALCLDKRIDLIEQLLVLGCDLWGVQRNGVALRHSIRYSGTL